MLQWMGGSRRKVTTTRKSAQNRQKQYFEQRKRRQQETSGLENFHDAIGTGREHHKEHRSLDVLSLLNLSTRPQENKTACSSDAKTSTAHCHYMMSPAPTRHNIETLEESAEFVDKRAPSYYKGEGSSPMKNIDNDRNNSNKEVESRPNQGKTSVEQNLSIFDLLCDDGAIGNSMGIPIKEAHVAFSVEGLGRVGMETPACSPQQTGRNFSYGLSPRLKARQPWNSSKNINMLDDLELEMDIMMQDIDKPYDNNSLKYSIGMMDVRESPEKSPARTSFQSVEDCIGNKCYGSRSTFDGMDGGRGRWEGGFNFLDNDFLGESEHNFFENNHLDRIDNDSTVFLKYGKFDISENAFDSPYLPKKRGAKRTMDKFNLFESAKSSMKHHTSEYDYDLTFDTKRNSRATRISDFEDKTLRPDWFCSMADDATDSFNLSEESCSSSAVRGEAFNSTPLNSNLRQSMRSCRDGDSGPGNSYSVNSIYSREPRSKMSERVDQGDHAHGRGKFAQRPNSSKSKSVRIIEQLGPSESWSFEKECNLSSIYQNPATDRPFRSSMPSTGDPFTGPAFPQSSFSNKHGETAVHPSSSLMSKRFTVHQSNVEAQVIERGPFPSSKLVGMYPDMAEATSSHGGDLTSPLISAQESVDKEEKGESRFSPSGPKKVNFPDEICIRSKELFAADDGEWLDASNNENKKCDSVKSEVQDESPATKINLEASHFSDNAQEAQPLSNKIPDESEAADENKYNHDDKVSVPFTKEEEEVNDFRGQGSKAGGSKNCSIDSSSQVMMLESYVLQLLFVQKVLKQASAQDYMKNT